MGRRAPPGPQDVGADAGQPPGRDRQAPCYSFEPGSGFGLEVGVRVELGLVERADSVGAFGWHGLASTFFRVDPAERLVLVDLAQHFPFDEHRLFGRVVNAVYARL